MNFSTYKIHTIYLSIDSSEIPFSRFSGIERFVVRKTEVLWLAWNSFMLREIPFSTLEKHWILWKGNPSGIWGDNWGKPSRKLIESFTRDGFFNTSAGQNFRLLSSPLTRYNTTDQPARWEVTFRKNKQLAQNLSLKNTRNVTKFKERSIEVCTRLWLARNWWVE